MAARQPKLLIIAEWLEVTNDPRQGSALRGVTMPGGFMWSSLMAVQRLVKCVSEKLFTSFRQIPDSGSVTRPLVIPGAGLSFEIPCRWFSQACCGSCMSYRRPAAHGGAFEHRCQELSLDIPTPFNIVVKAVKWIWQRVTKVLLYKTYTASHRKWVARH